MTVLSSVSLFIWTTTSDAFALSALDTSSLTMPCILLFSSFKIASLIFAAE
jgi:hypothetical protein